MNDKVTLLLTIAFIILAETSAQYCVKKCKVENAIGYMLLAGIFYFLVCCGLYVTYSYQTMGIVNAIWSALSVIAVTVTGMLLYHEQITRYDIFGMGLMIVGLFFIFGKDHFGST
jgi:multidrug transporter EmrE-like cation transporter